jgi:flagellar hook-basal body complex protein FliE
LDVQVPNTGIFSRIISGIVQDHAVERLAQNKSFQAFAVKAVDGFQEAQKKAEALGRQAAENPDELRDQVKSQATTFFSSLKAEIVRDLGRLQQELSDPPKDGAGAGKAAGGGKGDRDLR